VAFRMLCSKSAKVAESLFVSWRTVAVRFG
jgi:hypothetical protein